MLNILVVLYFLPVLEIFGTNTLPSYIKICKRQPDLSPCIKENAELCRPHFDKGIPELYLPPLMPFMLPKLTLEHRGFTLDLTDLKVYGIQSFELAALDIKMDNDFSMHAEIKIPSFSSDSMYSIKGKLLMLELNGHGHADANATDLVGTIDIIGTKVTRKGKEYAQIKEGTIVMAFNGPIKIHFDNLFGEREDLTQATNELIQENIMDFVKELQPVVENVILSTCLGIVKSIFNKYSLDELFPK